MKLSFQDGPRDIEIIARRDLVELHREELAVAFFRRLLREPGNRLALGRFLREEMEAGDLLLRTEDDLVRWLARKVLFGELRVLAHTRRVQPAPGATEKEATPREVEQAARAEPKAAPAPPAPAPAPEEETDPLLADTDPVAQAAVLQAAAESGAPLCDV